MRISDLSSDVCSSDLGTPVSIHLYVEDADAACAKAVQAGAKQIMAVQEMFWGDRYGLIEDPYGHRWSLATHVRDLSAEQIQEGARQMMDSQSECPGANKATAPVAMALAQSYKTEERRVGKKGVSRGR